MAILENQFKDLQATMRTPMGANIIDPQAFERNARAVNQMSAAYRTAVASSGQFHVQQMRLNNPVEEFTQNIEKQRLGVNKLRNSMGMLKAAYREQLALRQAMVASWGRDAAGNIVADLAVPSQVHKSWDTLSQRIAFTREVIRSASTQMINFGKNTQWAGRQLMVGFTMPVAAFGAVAGGLAYKADEQMTRITKVYDARARDIMAREQELQNVREAAMNTARTAAERYGSSLEDTLDVQAELAAQGLTGARLQETTNEVMRIASLGEIDRQDAMKASIALQQTLNASTQETATALNYMNAIENATSLATADFAKAIPIALNPMREMSAEGASATEVMQNLAMLLVAMRQNGIEAGEGANAIKAMMSRIYRPSKQVRQEWQKIADVDLTKIVEGANGNIMEILPQLADALEGMPKADRTQLLAGLFGTYQVSRMNAMLDGLEEVNNKASQTSRVLEVNEQGTQAWADTAENEIGRKMVSASGRFQAALQTLKVELADMGEPFLEAGTTLVEILVNLAQKFNALSDGQKEFLAWAAIAAAIVGPIIMLSGLFLNFIGHIARAGVAVTWILGRMKLLDREGVMAKAAMDLMGRGFTDASTAATVAARQVDVLNASISRARANAQVPVVTPGTFGGVVPVGTTTSPRTGPTTTTSSGLIVPTAAVQNSKELGDNLDQNNNKMRRFGTFAGIGVASLASMAMFSNEGADGMSKFVMQASLLAPILMMMPWGGMLSGLSKGISSAVTGLGKFASGASKVTGSAAKAGWRSIGTSALRLGGQFLKFLGPAGWIATAAIGLGTIYSKIDDAADATERLNNAGEEWAGILGFQHRQPEIKVDDESVNKTLENLEAAAKVRKELPEMVDEMRQAGAESARAVDIALTQGFQVIREGGTKQQAIKAVELALLAAFPENKEWVQDVLIEIRPQFRTDRTTTRAEAELIARDIARAMNNAAEKTGAEGFWDGLFGDPDDLTEDAIATAEGAGKRFYNALSGATDEIQMTGMFDRLETQFTGAYDKLLGPLKNNAPKIWEQFKRMGLGSAKAIADEYQRVQYAEWGPDKDRKDRIEQMFRDAGVSLDDFIKKANNVGEAQETMLRRIAELMHLDPEVIDDIETVRDLMNAAGFSLMSVKDAQAEYNRMVSKGVVENTKLGRVRRFLTEEEKLAALNQLRVAAGLERTTNLADGFNRKVTESKNTQGDLADETERQADAQEDVLSAMEKAQRRRNQAWKDMDFTSKYQEAMEETTSQIADDMTASLEREEEAVMERIDRRQERRMDEFDLATERREAQWDREMEQLENRQERAMRQFENEQERETRQFDAQQEREQRRFDDRWENRTDEVEEFYDKRIERIQKSIEAEERAEAVRQRIFDAEMTRIQRLAETTARNIDFNVALNSGDLDEAARITNEMAANEQTWTYEDAGAAGSRRSERRVSQLQSRIDAIEEERQTRIEALADMEERHRRRLEREQERERRAFEKTQERERRAFEKRQERARKELENEREMWQKRNELQRENLDKMFENTRESAQREFEVRRNNLDRALEALQRFIPRNRKELLEHIRNLTKDYGEFGTQLKKYGDNWGQHVGNRLTSNVKDAGRAIKNEIDWAAIGERAAAGMIGGAFGMNINEFKKWVGVDAGIGGGNKGGNKGGNDGGGYTPPPSTGQTFQGSPDPTKDPNRRRHSGGPVGGAMRGGIPFGSNPFPSETMIRAKNDEYVVDGKTHRKYGSSFFDSLKNGVPMPNTDGPGIGGIGDGLGLVGPIAMGMAKTMNSIVRSAIQIKGAEYQAAQMGAGMYMAGKPGEYGGRFFGKEQLKNAAIIASVGSSMNMSPRDIMIGIMTAITESGLINIRGGDRDSVGLFQQRTSQGWGSIKQIMDPEYAARKFFAALKQVGNRDELSPWVAAQTVQRSAFESGSNYKPYWDDAQEIFKQGLKFDPSALGVQSNGKRYPGVEPVSPWVREAAEYLGALHNVGTIGGYRPSSAVANSDHPKGLALDLMTRTFSQGNAIARTVEQMWKELDVTYMIWKQRIKTRPNGRWERMEDRGSPTANHMDHVHLSFEKNGDVDGLLRSGMAGEMAMGPGGRQRPVRGGHLTQGMHDTGTSHPAIDIGLPTGRPVYAAHDGRVSTSRDLRGNDGRRSNGGYYSYGRYVVIDGPGASTLYAHLSQRYARKGQQIRGGTKIGLSGNTGHSFGPHLHFGARGASPFAFVPGLRDGGNIRWDNTLANLHKDETVLTAPLSRDLEDGIRNLDTGGGDTYNVVVNPAPGMDEEALAEAVVKKIDRRKARVGRSRNVGGKK